MRFLSDEHFAAANAAFFGDTELQRSLPGVTLGIVYFVSAGPDGDFLYHIKIVDGAVTMASGDLPERDAEVRSSYETAAKMSRGEIANQTAVMMGKVRIKGGMMTMLRHQGVLNRVQAISSALAVTY
ncbi:MAG: SCP2 sterol-binding domain-containing protein [Gemmatimonadota bacterium]|nr:SCP2 sterol-binding domain-containing protein [Gemmatimonadota bacterium]